MTIYIACPNGIVTGGVELLHQLCYQMNTYDNVNAYIWYIMNNGVNKHPDAYKKYNNPIAKETHLNEAILIFPEIWVNLSLSPAFINNKKIIYWESVDNYFNHTEKYIQMIFPDNCIHLAQSYYALDFLQNKAHIDNDHIVYVSDYLNGVYLELYDATIRRERFVLYNPLKGLNFTTKIMNTLKYFGTDVTFIPIENMTAGQVRNLMLHSILYIDFGDFPGKDRIPREAVISGCCIITSRSGAANYIHDVNIPDKYKFDKKDFNIESICNTIKYILDHYEECNSEYEPYRQDIRKEYSYFVNGVDKLINLLSE